MKENAVAKRIGETIKRLRESKGMTIAEYATKINKDRSYVSKLEGGTFSPTIDNLQLFLDVLDCHIDIVSNVSGSVCFGEDSNNEDNLRKELAKQMATTICSLVGLKVTIE